MALEGRFSEPSWVIIFKTLIVIHILLSEGDQERVFGFLVRNGNVLDLHRFRDKNGTRSFDQSKNIRMYTHYLNERVQCYKEFRVDFVQDKYPSKTQINGDRKLDIKRLLQEVALVQRELHMLLKAKFFIDTVDNEVTFTALRLLIRDLLKLFQSMNAGVIKMLKNYFTISYDDMKRSLELYKRFAKLTDRVTDYLDNARQLQTAFGMSIPKLNHAPVSLSISLEEYLDTPEAKLPVEEKLALQKKGTAGTTPTKKNSPAPAKVLHKQKSFNTLPRKSNSPLAPTADVPKTRLQRSATLSKPMSQPAPRVPTTNVPSGQTTSTKAAAVQKDLIDFFSSIENEVVQPAMLEPTAASAQSVLDFSTPTFPQHQLVSSAGSGALVQSNPFSGQSTNTLALPGSQAMVNATSGSHNPFVIRQSMYSLPTYQTDTSQSVMATSNNALVPTSTSNTAASMLALPGAGTISHNPFTQRQSMFVDSSSNLPMTSSAGGSTSGFSNPFTNSMLMLPNATQRQPPPAMPASSDPLATLFDISSQSSGPAQGPTHAQVQSYNSTQSSSTTSRMMTNSTVQHGSNSIPLWNQPNSSLGNVFLNPQYTQQQPFSGTTTNPGSTFSSTGPMFTGNTMMGAQTSSTPANADATQPLFDAIFDTAPSTSQPAPPGNAHAPFSETSPFQPTLSNTNTNVQPNNPFGFRAF
ncbi:hypothetical protein IWQ62_005583 [Dispira parvispora]|uniref:ENTH domain-containing protein n=1 Tax=Dispira parvispora TaxID=1520584 RepID=A0A9W8AMJ3_9FUNG|nr:hypothetical protein IWQ62_005583 [Dispira parvispora]